MPIPLRWQYEDPLRNVRAMVNAVFDQRAYRFRNDNGNETTATWMANQNTPITIEANTRFRLRIAVQETAGGGSNNVDHTLRFRVGGASGTWFDVTNTSSPVKAVASPNFPDPVGTVYPTTKQLTGTTGTFRAGEINSNGDYDSRTTYSGNDHSEHEWVIEIENSAAGSMVEFRCLQNGTAPTTVTAMATITNVESSGEHHSGGSTASVGISSHGEGAKEELWETSVVLDDNIAATTYLDTTVEPGAWYRYQVEGSDPETGPSEWVIAQAPGEVSGQHESGGSTSTVAVSSEGAGEAKDHIQGGSTSAVVVSSEGAGQANDHIQDGSTSIVVVSSEGAGQGNEVAQGSSEAVVEVQTVGEGYATETATGSSVASVEVTSEGAGTALENVADGSTAIVEVWSEGEGFADDSPPPENFTGGSVANVAVLGEGAGTGFEESSSGGESVVEVSSLGGGIGFESAFGSGEYTVTAIAEGEGTATEISSSGGEFVIEVWSEGEGLVNDHMSGGGESVVIVTSSGGGIADFELEVQRDIDLLSITDPFVLRDIDLFATSLRLQHYILFVSTTVTRIAGISTRVDIHYISNSLEDKLRLVSNRAETYEFSVRSEYEVSPVGVRTGYSFTEPSLFKRR